MNTNKDASFRQCFVLTDQELGKLHRALTEFSDDIEIEIRCADGLNRNVSSVEELVQFENPPNKDIQELVLSSRGLNPYRSARLRFMNRDDANVWLTMEGPEESVVRLNSSVEDRLASMKPWYAPFAKVNFVVGAFVLIGVAYIGLLVVAATGILVTEKTAAPDVLRSTALGNLIALAAIGVPLILGFALNRWRKSLFPIGVFAIGQGQKRHADREWVRSTVVVGFVVSLVAGIVVLLVSR